jgi:hypothetical protein
VPEIDIVSTFYTTGQDLGNAGRARHARPAVALLFCLIASTAAAQGTPAPGGQGATPAPVSTPTPAPAPAAAPAPAPAGDLVRTNPAAPQPNPNLASTGAVPGRRGFYRAEPFDIYPFLGVGLGWTDNLLGQAANPVSSSLLVVSPRVQAETRTGAHVHSLRYGGSYGHYASSSPDDFAVHEFVASTVNQFSARTDLSATAYYLQQQDPRGLSVRAILAEPDRWQGYGANVRAGYGAISAQGRLEGDLGFTSKTYSNNREVTARLDVSTVDGAGRFFYRLTPRIRALTELRMTAFDYDSASLDNFETRMLVGATWDISATSIFVHRRSREPPAFRLIRHRLLHRRHLARGELDASVDKLHHHARDAQPTRAGLSGRCAAGYDSGRGGRCILRRPHVAAIRCRALSPGPVVQRRELRVHPQSNAVHRRRNALRPHR